jgi:hypothetical protein
MEDGQENQLFIPQVLQVHTSPEVGGGSGYEMAGPIIACLDLNGRKALRILGNRYGFVR